MWKLNGNTVRILRVSIALSILALALLVYLVWHDISNDAHTGVDYDAPSYTTIDAGPFCPGDVLRYNVTATRDRIAPIDVRSSWCNVASGVCLTESGSAYHVAIFDLRQPVTRERFILIPGNPRFTPGEWVYVHQIAVANTSNWRTYVVPFTIAEDCPS
jgi:hypothetical protein